MRSQCARWVLLVGLVWWVTPVSAWGASKLLTVVRGTGAGADKAAGFVGYYVREQLAQDKRYTLADMDAVMGSTRAEQATREFAAAEELAEQGKVAYESLDLDLAVQYFEQAIDRYRTQIAYLSNIEPVAKILMMLGATHILRGEEQVGVERLTQALRISPSIEPDPRIFNPAMRRIFDGVAESMATQAVGSLAVSSNPSYAEVFVDGVFRGITPLTLDGLGVGEHWVRIVKEGYHSTGEVQKVLAQGDNAYVATLRPERIADQYERLAQDVAQRAQKSPKKVTDELLEMATLAHADYVLVIAVQLDGDRVQLNASQFNIARKKYVASGNNILGYSTEGDVYRREVRAMLLRSFGEDVVPASGATVAEVTGSATSGTTKSSTDAGSTGAQPSAPGAAGTTSGAMASDATKPPPAEIAMGAEDGSCSRWQWCQTKNKVALGLGLGGLVMAGAGGGLWSSAKTKHDAFPSKPQISKEASDLRTSGRTMALAGDVLVIAGSALIVGAVAAFFWPAKKAVSDDDSAVFQKGRSVPPAIRRSFAQRVWSDMQWTVGPQNGGAMMMTTFQY